MRVVEKPLPTTPQPSYFMLLNAACCFLNPVQLWGPRLGEKGLPVTTSARSNGDPVPSCCSKSETTRIVAWAAVKATGRRSQAIRERRWEDRKGGEHRVGRETGFERALSTLCFTHNAEFLLSESLHCASPRAQEVVKSILAPNSNPTVPAVVCPGAGSFRGPGPRPQGVARSGSSVGSFVS